MAYVATIYLFPFSTFVTVHPWRIISLFFVLLITHVLLLANKTNSLLIKSFFIAIFLYYNFFTIERAAANFYYPENNAQTSPSIINKIINLEPELLIIPAYKQEHMKSPFLDIELKTSIPTYATYKFTPVKISSYNRWESRIQKIANFYDGNCNEFKENENVYFIDIKENNPCGNIVHQDQDVYIYKLSNNQ